MMEKFPQADLNSNYKVPPKKRRVLPWLIIFAVVFLCLAGVLFYRTNFIFSQIRVDQNPSGILPVSEDAPKIEKDPDRINILLLGLRGPGDPNGGLLTDTMMLISVKKSTAQAAMISIPRDLYIKMPAISGQNSKAISEKINFAYALGEETKTGLGLAFSKAAVSNVTGLYIDYAASVDFTAFKEIVDILGGVDIYLDKPFKETAQFDQEFLIDLPAGQNHLDGQAALYFVRARYSTSDFDRARRQQQVLLAIKDKALSLGILLNPVKIFELLNSLGKNVRTDASLGDINNLIGLANQFDFKNAIHKVFDTSSEGLLYATTSDSGAYILQPVGDNFDKIRETCKNIFN